MIKDKIKNEYYLNELKDLLQKIQKIDVSLIINKLPKSQTIKSNLLE